MDTLQQMTHAELAINRIESSRSFVGKLIDTLSDDQLLKRPEGWGNHATWILGHMAFAEDTFVSAFRGDPSSLPDGHVELFEAGTEPLNNADAYPTRTELLDRLTTAQSRVTDWARTLTGDAAWQPTPEALAHLTPNAIGSIHTLAEHNFLHGGQVAAIRSSLGMKPLFM